MQVCQHCGVEIITVPGVIGLKWVHVEYTRNWPGNVDLYRFCRIQEAAPLA